MLKIDTNWRVPVLVATIVVGMVIGQAAYTLAGAWYMRCDKTRTYICQWGPSPVCMPNETCQTTGGTGFCVSSNWLYGCLLGGAACPGFCATTRIPCTRPAPAGSCR